MALAERAATELSGDDQRRWLDRLELAHDDIRTILDRAVAQPDPPVAIGLAFSCGGSGRSTAISARRDSGSWRWRPSPWSRDDARLRARLLEALGGVCWWQGDLQPMRQYYEEALGIWQGIGDDRELANAYYNVSFSYALGEDGTFGTAIRRAWRGLHECSPRGVPEIGDQRGEANALWGLGTLRYFKDAGGRRRGGVPAGARALRQDGRPNDGGWALHMLGSALIRRGLTAEAKDAVGHAVSHFHSAGDVAGLTLTFFDLSAVAVQEGDIERAARLRGAARNLSTETGAGLAMFDGDAFELAGPRPTVRDRLPPEDLERLEAEGAAMTLDEAVAYALEGGPVDGEHA